MSYEHDLRLELKFDRILKSILGNCFIQKNTNLDKLEGTDFIVYEIKPFKIGVRLRTHKYFLDYPDEFTIRYSRPSGVNTEIHKIQQGLVNYFLYGFVNPEETKIIKWFVGDLEIFRSVNPEPLQIKQNIPPDSMFAVYNLNQFPESFIINQWSYVPSPDREV